MVLPASNSLNVLDLVKNKLEKYFSENFWQSFFWHPIYRGLIFFKIESKKANPRPPLPTSFSHATSTNVAISPQNFLTFTFNHFFKLVWNFKFIPSASPKLLNLNQDHSSKKWIFWSSPYKSEDMIISLIKMLPNFGYMTTS